MTIGSKLEMTLATCISIFCFPEASLELPIAEFLHVKPGKGAAFVRSKIKNYLTGSIQDKTFRAGEPLQAAMVERKDAQFSYVDGEDVCCLSSSIMSC